jgi:uncharacterized protein (TIGR02598 family)
MILSPTTNSQGITLIETIVAAAISALFLGTLFTFNIASMETIKMSRESACASQILQQRVESLRIANWHQVTDSTWLRTNLLNTDAAGTSQLKSVSETLTLTPYGSTSTGSIQLTRSNGTAAVVNNSYLLTENAVKIVWSVNYKGAPNDRTNTRQTVAILAKGGVAKW